MGIVLLTVVSCKKINLDQAPGDSNVGTISSYLHTNYDFSLFDAAVQKAGLEDSLDRTELAFTVMAPLNLAFNKEGIYAATDFDKWPADSLKTFVKDHIIPGKLFYSDIPQTSDNLYKNLNGTVLYVSNFPGGQIPLAVNGIVIQAAGTVSTSATINYGSTQLNGVVYPLVNTLKIVPGTVQDMLAARPDLSRLVAGLKKFGLWDRLGGKGPFTIVAPLDTAFDREAMTADLVNGLDVAQYDPVLFGIYSISPNHIFLTDLVQLQNGALYQGFPTLSDTLDLMLNVNGSALDFLSASVATAKSVFENVSYGSLDIVGPTYHGFSSASGTHFLGEPPGTFSYTNAANPPAGRYVNFACSNGVVHLLSGILLRPSDVKK